MITMFIIVFLMMPGCPPPHLRSISEHYCFLTTAGVEPISSFMDIMLTDVYQLDDSAARLTFTGLQFAC